MHLHNALKLFTLLPIQNKTNSNRHVIWQLHSINYKKKWNLIQNSPAVKKVRPSRMLLWKKMWNIKWWPRNGCDSRLKANILIMTVQWICVPNCTETWRRQHKFTWIVNIKIFAFSLPSQPFLGRHFIFHIFFTTAFLMAAPFFYSWAVLD